MNGLVFLYFTACVATAPDTCQSDRLALDVPDALVCQRRAQPQLARWVEQHPSYRITAWRCGAPPRSPGNRI